MAEVLGTKLSPELPAGNSQLMDGKKTHCGAPPAHWEHASLSPSSPASAPCLAPQTTPTTTTVAAVVG